jgi:GR25 family glycosyltransferase involved in LPS biosynthesis
MIDIFSLPLFYISFKPSEDVEKHYRSHGFKNVNHFEAVNGKKLDPDKLREDNLITIRSYDDLKSGRREHSGMPSLGAIGCTLSHYELWTLCVKNGWPYMIIAEEDNQIDEITTENAKDISDTLSKPRGVFMSVNIVNEDHRKHFFGTHFYFITAEACQKLIDGCFPIDVQTDWYMAHMGTTKDVTMEGYRLSRQKFGTVSSIQDICVTCRLPKSIWFYVGFLIFVFAIIFLAIFFKKKWSQCKESKSCE